MVTVLAATLRVQTKRLPCWPGAALKHAALADIAQGTQLPAEPAVVLDHGGRATGGLFHGGIEPRKRPAVN